MNKRARSETGLLLGALGALCFAAWLGVPAINYIAAGHLRDGVMRPIELAIVGLLIASALVTAWRFLVRRGWIAGPMLMVALLVEVIKRIVLAIQGNGSFGIPDAAAAVVILYSLASGIRSARIVRKQE